MFVSKTQINIATALIITVSLFGFVFHALTVDAAPNQQINYQGKLTTAANVAVEDGVYNMRFWLLTSPSIATTSAVWTESLTGTNKVTVTNGLFSIMLGSTSPLTSVDFNQTLYLGVEIGGSTTPAWDGEMSPRKILGTVPSAFEADKLDGLTSSQFVRTDATSSIAVNTADTLLTITQNGAGDILNIFDGATEVFSILDGGNVGIGSSSPNARLTVLNTSGGSAPLFVVASSTNGLATSTALFVSSTGLVGIGTNAPSVPLTVSGLSGVILDVRATVSDVYQTLTSQDGSAAYIYQRNGGGLAGFTAVNGFSVDIYGGSNSVGVFKNTGDVALGGTITSPTSYAGAKMVINGTTGNVGVGTTSPSRLLTVQGGDIWLGGNFTATGTAQVASLNVTASSTLGYASSTALTVLNNTYLNTYTANAGTTTNATTTNLAIVGITGSTQCLQVTTTGLVVGTGSACGSGSLGGAGLDGYLARWTGTATLSTGLFRDNGTVAGVGATTSTSTFLVQGTGGVNPFSVASSTGANLFNILGSGNVGIGTSSPSSKLHIHDGVLTLTQGIISGNYTTINATDGSNVGGVIASRATAGTNPMGYYFTNYGDGVKYGMEMNIGNDIVFYGHADPNSSIEAIRIQNNTGNVGIGSTTPSRLLTVGGDIYAANITATGTMTTANFVGTSGTTTNASSTNLFAGLARFTNASTTYASTTALSLYGSLFDRTSSAGTNGMVLQTNGSGATWVATSSLGLGMSNWLFNGSRLSPSTTVGIGVFASSTIGGGTGATGLTISGGATTTGNAYFGGSVGIGTSGPDFGAFGAGYTVLGIEAAVTPIINFKRTTATSGVTDLGIFDWYNGTTRVSQFEVQPDGATDSGLMKIWTKPTGGSIAVAMTIKGNGNIGIGTSSPSTKLEIFHDTSAYASTAYNTPSLYLQGSITDGDYTGIGFKNYNASRESLFGVVQASGGTGDFVWQGYTGSVYQEFMRLRANGSLGVGSTTPGYRLTVQGGDTYLGGNVTATGTLALSGLGTFTSGLVSQASSTIAALTVTTGTTTNATSTNLFATSGFFTNLKINALRDSANSLGTNGQILQTNGSGATWVATSTLGLSGGSSNWTDNGTYLSTLGAGDGIIVAGSSTIGGGTNTSGLTISGGATTTGRSYFAQNMSVGTNNAAASLSVGTTSATTNTTLALLNLYRDTSGTAGVGIGGSINTYLERDDGTQVIGSTIETSLTQVNSAQRSSLNFYTTNNGLNVTPNLTLDYAGNVIANTQLVSTNKTIVGGSSSGVSTGVHIYAAAWTYGLYVDQSQNSSNNQGIYSAATGVGGANNTAAYFTATGATNNFGLLVASGRVGLGTTTPAQQLSVAGGMHLTGALYDSTYNQGTNGMVLQTNGSGVTWVATSTLGLSGGSSNWTDNGTYLSTLGAGDGIIVAGSSTIGGGTGATGLTISGNSTTTLNSYIGGSLGIGTTSPSATLAVTGSGTTDLFRFASSTGSNLLTLDARGVLNFGTTTNADIFLNGGATSTQTQGNGNNVAIGNEAFSYYTSGSAIGNTAFGYRALYGSSSVPMTGDNNVAMGTSALLNNTTGSYNNALGIQALQYNTTGSYNNAMGRVALLNNTTGTDNNAFGYATLLGNISGIYNNAIGFEALKFNNGNGNNALGVSSLTVNTTGAYNDAIGGFALGANSTGSFNNAIGTSALGSNTTGSDNIGLGSSAGLANTVGTSSIFIGNNAGNVGTAADLFNATAIGAYAQVNRSNAFVLGGTGAYNVDVVTGTTSPWAKLSIMNNYGSTTALFDIATTTSSAFATSSIFRVGHDGRVSLGSTTPEGLLLTMQRTGITGADVAGIKQYFQFTSNASGSIAYGDNTYIVNAPTATSTLVGKIIRVEDSTAFGNTVRGLEVQAHRGTNTKGENTGISGFGRTFGLRGTTEGDAGDSLVPAGVFAQSRGTTQGNALRAYSGSITTSSLAQLFHDTSVFSGTGLLMNFGNSGGSFAATSSAKFLDFQVGGTSKFMVTAGGTTTIGDGTTGNMAGLQIGYGGLCVDNDGACTATTTGRITSVSLGSGNSDLAEMYFSSDDLETGEIVAMKGGLSIERADATNGALVIGVVSTKPGLLLGFDDTSLAGGEASYPVGLKGRVPVKLSTENGPIVKGDRIALSSIAGVGMKATESSVVVGIALEDYDGEHAYTEGYMNQFGDDLVKAKMKPLNQNMDARTQDGCSYGGGAEQGETPCVKDKVGKVKVATVEVDTLTEVIEELENEEARTSVTPSGKTVAVGQALMFIDLQYYTIASEQSVLAELLSTSTVENGNEGETLWSRIKVLAQNFVDGVLTIAGIKTDELCVGNVCVDEGTFLKMVEKAGEVSTAGVGDANDDDVPPPEDEESSDGGTGGASDTPPPTPEPEVTPDPAPIVEEPEASTEESPETEEAPLVEDSIPVPQPEPEPEVAAEEVSASNLEADI